MKFTCDAKDIAASVGAASKIVNSHTTVPILSNVLLTADGETVKVRATDLELTLEQEFKAEVSEPGEVTVPAKIFSGYLSNLPSGQIALEGSQTKATVAAQKSKYDFNALNPEEYPPLPAVQKSSAVSMDASFFKEGVNAVIFAASSEEARGAVLMGTLLEISGNDVTMVATDGYRLSKWTANLTQGIEGTAKYIIPSRALAEAVRNVGGASVIELAALANNSQLKVTAGSTALTVRLVDGQYPNYGQVIPKSFDREITVNAAALIGALRRAELVAGDRASMVKLAIGDGKIILTANSDISGNAYEEIEVEQECDGLTIAFNARYLVEILNHIESPRAIMKFSGPMSPCMISPSEKGDGGEQSYILMPLRQ